MLDFDSRRMVESDPLKAAPSKLTLSLAELLVEELVAREGSSENSDGGDDEGEKRKKDEPDDSRDQDDEDSDEAGSGGAAEEEQIEARLLDMLAALMLTSNGGFSVKTWAAKLLVRCVCQRLGGGQTSARRLLHASAVGAGSHADLDSSLPPMRTASLWLPNAMERSLALGGGEGGAAAAVRNAQLPECAVTAVATASSDEMLVAAGSDQGMVIAANRSFLLHGAFHIWHILLFQLYFFDAMMKQRRCDGVHFHQTSVEGSVHLAISQVKLSFCGKYCLASSGPEVKLFKASSSRCK